MMKGFLVGTLILSGIGFMATSVYYQGPGPAVAGLMCWVAAGIFNMEL